MEDRGSNVSRGCVKLNHRDQMGKGQCGGHPEVTEKRGLVKSESRWAKTLFDSSVFDSLGLWERRI